MDRANFHGFFNVQLALGELRAAGYKHTGLVVPEDIGLAYLYRTEAEMKTWPGIDGNLQAVGAAAFDLVVEGLDTNRIGAPADPKDVLIKGTWRRRP